MYSLRQRARQRVHDELIKATTRKLVEPSYTYKRLELARIRGQMRSLGIKEPVFEVNAKDDAHAWATRLGLRTPRLLGTFAGPTDVPWGTLPDLVVVKPVRGSTSHGVYLLARRGNSWKDIRTGELLPVRQITNSLQALAGRDEISSAVLVEELVSDPRRPGLPPIDYKITTFFGQVGWIEVKVTGPDIAAPHGNWRNFDANWNDLGSVMGDPMDRSLGVPAHADALLDTARLVSASVPRPFLRVDLYEDELGPVFGEITPDPGGNPHILPEVDRMLGRMWEDAETRLKIRAVRAGQLSPAVETLPEAQLGLAAPVLSEQGVRRNSSRSSGW